MSTDGQGTKRRSNMTHERYRRQRERR